MEIPPVGRALRLRHRGPAGWDVWILLAGISGSCQLGHQGPTGWDIRVLLAVPQAQPVTLGVVFVIHAQAVPDLLCQN